MTYGHVSCQPREALAPVCWRLKALTVQAMQPFAFSQLVEWLNVRRHTLEYVTGTLLAHGHTISSLRSAPQSPDRLRMQTESPTISKVCGTQILAYLPEARPLMRMVLGAMKSLPTATYAFSSPSGKSLLSSVENYVRDGWLSRLSITSLA